MGYGVGFEEGEVVIEVEEVGEEEEGGGWQRR